MALMIGATFKVDEIGYWSSRIPTNHWFRIFPNSDGMPPAWSDARFVYCRDRGVVPFISTKIDGDATKLNTLKVFLQAMPAWVTKLYLTDRHEPEGDVSAAAFQANINALLAMLDTLDPALRARIKAGPVLTRQAVENKPVATPTTHTGSNPTGGTYSTYDPGTGDFLGVDFYGNSWDSADATKATTAFVPPATILAKVKAYKKSNGDTRPRIFPEIGYIGAPFDTNGNARAQWLAGIVAEVATWNSSNPNWVMPWQFEGLIWWNTQGKSGSSLTGVGKTRWFQLDRRHNGAVYGSDPEGGYTLLTNSPVLAKFNEIVAAQGEDPEDPDGPEDPDDPEGPDDPENPDPDASLTATPEPGASPPRVLLEVTYAGQAEATVTRLDPDGVTRTVRLAGPASLVSGVWVGYDYESHFNAATTYTATTPVGAVTSNTVSLLVDVPWLRHPGVPSLSIPVEVIPPLEERSHGVNQAVLQPLGRRYPIVVSDGRRKAATSSLTFRTVDEAEAAALKAVLDDVAVLLLDAPEDHGLGFVHEYLAFGELRERRFDPSFGPNPWRNWTVGYTVVGSPAGGQQAQRTWATVLAENGSWSQVISSHSTWSDVLTGAS